MSVHSGSLQQPNVVVDKFIGLLTIKSLKLSTSDNLLEETNWLFLHFMLDSE